MVGGMFHCRNQLLPNSVFRSIATLSRQTVAVFLRTFHTKGVWIIYKIVRTYYANPKTQWDPYWGDTGHLSVKRRTIKTGLTLEEAQTHCHDPETSSRTATSTKARRITRKHGKWFDGYTET